MRRVILRLAAVVLVTLTAGACGDDRPGTSGPSAGPQSTERPAAGDHRLSLTHNGLARTYIVHAPPAYDPAKPLPLVIAMHFYPGTGEDLQELVGLDAKADREGFLVAYPDGHGGGFNAMVCCGSNDDVGFISTLTRHLVQTWKADPDRVYLTGISNGGDMSFRLAVEAPGLFAAIGVVSGGFGGPKAERADFAPKTPVSVVTFIGGQDRYFPIFEGGVATWRERQRCTPTGEETRPVYRRTSSRCADGSDVEVYVVPEMGHVWPGGTGRMGAPDAGIVATDVMWAFFAAHPRIR